MQFLTRNLWWKLLALAAAFGVWLNVANEPELATIVSVPVEYNHFPKDLEISSDIVETIDVEARGSSGQLRSLHDSRIAAVVDFAGVNAPGERTFTLTTGELKLPRGIDLIRTIPAQLRFKFEKRANRLVSVEVPLSGKLPAGFSVASVDVEPPQLRITGPESHVLGSGKLVSDPFDLTNARLSGSEEDATQTLAVYAAEPEVRILNTPQVRVKIRVQQRHR
jgi:YbbR domain-containing protein